MLSAAETRGLSDLAQLVFDQADLEPVWAGLVARVSADEPDAGALLDLSTILQLTGQRAAGLEVQAQALAQNRLYRRRHGHGDGLRVLAFVAAGDLMANFPIDFLLDGSGIDLHLFYVQAGERLPHDLPEHDLAFLAIGESDSNRAALEGLHEQLASLSRPCINREAHRVAILTRNGVSALLAHSGNVLAPATRRVARVTVAELAAGEAVVGDLLIGASMPIIIRPVASHAGQDLSKIVDADELSAYLEGCQAREFYISQFVDYSAADGLFRKQRVAVIDGVPFASHMAVSEHWMVHYLSAGMAERPERRAEEEAFMADFETGFAMRHVAAFQEMHRLFGLDYFAIDCGEMPDGRLLLFEADVAMIVHAMDPASLFPYKKPAMRKLFSAFQHFLERTAADSVAG